MRAFGIAKNTLEILLYSFLATACSVVPKNQVQLTGVTELAVWKERLLEAKAANASRDKYDQARSRVNQIISPRLELEIDRVARQSLFGLGGTVDLSKEKIIAPETAAAVQAFYDSKRAFGSAGATAVGVAALQWAERAANETRQASATELKQHLNTYKWPTWDELKVTPSLPRAEVRAPVFAYKSRWGFGSASAAAVDAADKDLLQISGADDTEAKEELLQIPTLAARESETGPRAFGGASMPTSWRPARALMALRAQLMELAPRRDKSSDGMVGDRAHWLRGEKSDHNPWVRDSSNLGVVTAYDVTHSPSTGCDVQKLVDSLVRSRDVRIKYIIWNHRIINSDAVGGVRAWTWRAYRGENPHDKHMHLSVLPTSSRYDDTQSWNIAIR